jgi:hypothetical protein
MTRQVTGTLLKPDGSADSSKVLNFYAIDSVGDSILAGVLTSITTDGFGAYDVTLENGYYRVQIGRGLIAGDITIVDGVAIDLPSLLSD